MRIQRRHPRGGFTLIEAIATIVILAALGSVGSSILMTAMNGYTSAAIRAQLHSEESIALDRIIRELRKVPRDTGAGGTAPLIASVTANSLAWNSNYTLSMSSTNLMFVENGGTSRVLLPDVSSFAVQTYDESNVALAASLSGASCYPIRRIQISISMSRYGVTESLRTRLFIRPVMVGSS